ncbi:hypothetical protein OS493_025378 [Desmophyllum pertusum]|uniref:THAP-type domain-containing protein n=1 Tax=Desmophyllum pertusum TaxID=174260 RepID=A0A9W9YXR2_9CNID|nr:hypothetical protein OS493_025378 [Desmophyllum pertusum]
MALGCFNNSSTRSDITFYKLPVKDERLVTIWLMNTRKLTIPPNRKCFVCQEHFEPECFGRDLRAELLGDKPKPQLLKGAAPTLFLHNNFKANVPKRRVFSEQRKIRKEKEEILKDLLGPYFHMKPVALEKQNLSMPDSPMEDEEVDDKFSIQSLLPGFACAHGNEASTDDDVSNGHDQTRANNESTSTIHDQCESRMNGETSVSHKENQSRTFVTHKENPSRTCVTHKENQSRTSVTHKENQSRSCVTHKENLLRTCVTHKENQSRTCVTRKENQSRTSVTHKENMLRTCVTHKERLSRTSETSCQTEENPTTEISCQTNKPDLVTTGTQWDEKDFLPDPELVQRDHTYSKRKRPSK